MLKTLVKMIFGSRNERLLKQMNGVVKKINAMASEIDQLSDAQLKQKTQDFKARLAQGEKLNALLPEAFAVVREASQRSIGLRHYDVQLIGGMVLHHGKIVEMRTGEGKTLVATLPLYLNALTGHGVHLVTVNDYLAKRDAQWMGEVYGFLGLTTGTIVSGMTPAERKAAYACDITYGTNNEFGFDYLRDNMVFSHDEQVQRGLNFAVVDEVDSILIDEARTPLVISGPAEGSSEWYQKLNTLIPKLSRRETEEGAGDYYLDEQAKQAFLTEAGHQKVEEALARMGMMQQNESLYSLNNVSLMHYVNAALRAHTLFHLNTDYIVRDDEVMIVDEHTGRVMAGRRWSDGLHQAIEAKEGVKVQGENKTMASITYQNYFRLYDKLSGMTGTADTEAFEFHQIYDLEVVVIPTHKPTARKDQADMVFLTQQEKYQAILKEIKRVHQAHQPLLVGTASIESSELLSKMLHKACVQHEVLNAKQHEREAHIIAQAGNPGAITIATNMAGRGTDIVLGGNWQEDLKILDDPNDEQVEQLKTAWMKNHQKVIAAGGLYILGTERHESRRIDNQLRGRAGRQGDPGESRFFLSLEDPVIRIFAPKWMAGLMRKTGMGDGEPLESRMVTRAITNAQRKVESYHFDVRKQLLAYDDIASDQRLVIYKQRDDLLRTEDVSEIVSDMQQSVVQNVFVQFIPPDTIEEQWDVKGLEATLKADFDVDVPVVKLLAEDETLTEESLFTRVQQAVDATFAAKLAQVDAQNIQQFQKMVLMQSLDNHWREHINNLEYLRHSINLRGYAQKDPKQEYKRESFEMFSEMLDSFKYEVVSTISKVQIVSPEEIARIEEQKRQMAQGYHLNHQAPQSAVGEALDEAAAGQPSASAAALSVVQSDASHYYDGKKVGRNAPCPCGSSKKFKHCHGKIT